MARKFVGGKIPHQVIGPHQVIATNKVLKMRMKTSSSSNSGGRKGGEKGGGKKGYDDDDNDPVRKPYRYRPGIFLCYYIY